MIFLCNTLAILTLCVLLSTGDQLIATSATMELILTNDNNVRTSKYIRGKYTTAGATTQVEGYIDQVHPNTLCSSRPDIKFRYIYILKLEKQYTDRQYDSSCQSAADKVTVAIRHGAAAVILLTTGYTEQAKEELKEIMQPLERPVLVVDEELEEDKLFAILSHRDSAYINISPLEAASGHAASSNSDGDIARVNKQETITYIGIAVIFGLIAVLLVIATAVILKMRNMRHRIQAQTRERLLQSIGTHKYRQKRVLSSSRTGDSPGPCPICLEQYRVGEELRLLPCTHQYHKKCIDKWLMEHRTCPCCCGDIDELLRLGTGHSKGGYNKSVTNSSGLSQVHTHSSIKPLLSHIDSTNNSCFDDSMRELLPPNQRELFVHRQYQYLLNRLYEIKRQRPSSTTLSDTEASNRLSVLSSCYGSTFDIESSLPDQNSFIGDFCQGGEPKKCDELLLCDIDMDCKSVLPKQYTSSKSTLPSQESPDISPRVSELNLSEGSSTSRHHCPKCNHRCSHKSGHYKHKQKLQSILRTVRFREPESEIMSSTEEEVDMCHGGRCLLCREKRNTYTSEGSSRSSRSSNESDTSSSSKYVSISRPDHHSSTTNNIVLDDGQSSEPEAMVSDSSSSNTNNVEIDGII